MALVEYCELSLKNKKRKSILTCSLHAFSPAQPKQAQLSRYFDAAAIRKNAKKKKCLIFQAKLTFSIHCVPRCHWLGRFAFCIFTMPIPIPSPSHAQQQLAWSPTYSLSSSTSSSSFYPDFVRELTSKAPTPYGTIPPRRRKKRRKSTISEESSSPGQAQDASPDEPSILRIQRRMSHVEDWVKVDSKESLPDDDELVSPFQVIYLWYKIYIRKRYLTSSIPVIRVLRHPCSRSYSLPLLLRYHMYCHYMSPLQIYQILQSSVYFQVIPQ